MRLYLLDSTCFLFLNKTMSVFQSFYTMESPFLLSLIFIIPFISLVHQLHFKKFQQLLQSLQYTFLTNLNPPLNDTIILQVLCKWFITDYLQCFLIIQYIVAVNLNSSFTSIKNKKQILFPFNYPVLCFMEILSL